MFSRSKSTKLNMDSLVSLNLLTKLSLDCHITQPLQIDISIYISEAGLNVNKRQVPLPSIFQTEVYTILKSNAT